MHQIYNYDKACFDKNGFDQKGNIFTDLIKEWELEFYSEFKPFYANHLRGNYATITLIQSCFEAEELGHFGMDGDFDIETNIKMDGKPAKPLVYALECSIRGKEDEPLFLFEDSSISDGVVILKHITDDGNEIQPSTPTDEKLVGVPVNKFEQ